MSTEPESLVLHLLREMRAETASMRAEMASMRAEMATKGDLAALRSEVKSDMTSLRADIAADLHMLQAKMATGTKHAREQIEGLRRALMDYHASVVSQGVLVGEHDARLHRIEKHLDLAAR